MAPPVIRRLRCGTSEANASSWAMTPMPRGVLGQRRAAPLVIRVLRRQREDRIAGAPGRVWLAGEADRSGRRREDAGEQLEQRRLAGAVRADEPIGAARLQRHV